MQYWLGIQIESFIGRVFWNQLKKNKVSKRKKKQMENLFIDVIVMVLLPQ